MKRPTWLAMFGVVAAFAVVGVVSANSFSSPLAIGAVHENQETNPFGMMGHITMTIYDSAGNLIEYRQTDNTIVNAGENCVAEAMFDVNVTTGADSDNCLGSGISGNSNGFADGGYRFIQIGSGSTGGDDSAEDDGALLIPYTVSTMGIQEDLSPSLDNPSSGTGANSAAVVTISANFTATADGQDVNESGLFDKSASFQQNMLARQGFSNVTLNTGDELTVEWEITIGSDTP